MARKRKRGGGGGRLVFMFVIAVMLVVIYRVGYDNPPEKRDKPQIETPVADEQQEEPGEEPEEEEWPDEEELEDREFREAFYATLSDSDKKIFDFAEKNGISLGHYPRSLRELLARNPETEEFVLNYPFYKDGQENYDIPEMDDLSQGVPLLMQWDCRWGYTRYGSDMMAVTGCGPTALSMAAMYLLNDKTLDPGWMADFSTEHGYCVPGNGSMWSLIYEGGELLGLEVEEIPLHKNTVREELKAGHPIIMIMGPGDFTKEGHFIVVVDWVDGKLKINDPNSKIRSAKLWEYEEIENQVSNLWALKKG